jgi:hypothetical protein
MKPIIGMALVFIAGVCLAKDVGVFATGRMNGAANNIKSGANVATLRSIWEGYGAAWSEADLITPEFLSGVKVFYTGNIANIPFTTAEQDATVNWVKSGGVLVVTGECG